MVRNFALILLCLALFVAACSSEKSSPPASRPDAAEEPTAVDDSTTLADSDPAGNPFLAGLNPLELMSGLEGLSAGPADPKLASLLLETSDLPPGFVTLGEFGATVTSEYGDVNLATNVFTNGDPESDDLAAMGTMVMSAAIALPPEAVEDLQQTTDEFSQEDLEQLLVEAGDVGGFFNVELLDASGLGDGGFGMRLTMDLGDLASAFGAPEEKAEAAAIVMETFVFQRGERMLMVLTAWPEGQSSEADARELAEALDEKAG